MSRSLPCAVAAFLPLAGAALIAVTPDDPSRVPFLFPQTDFFILYWFAILVGVLFVQMLFFAVHAWRNPRVGPNRRIPWVVAIVFFAFVATPLYWWHYSETAT
jgi:hypothetical protein